MMDLAEIDKTLDELCALPLGWCSYCPDCQPVCQATADMARHLALLLSQRPSMVTPIKSRGPDGSWVQFEWHGEGEDYAEVEIDPAGWFNMMWITDTEHKERLSIRSIHVAAGVLNEKVGDFRAASISTSADRAAEGQP